MQALLISGTVPSGSGSPLLAGFRWLSVQQQVLNACSYVIAATSSGDPASFDPFLYEGFDPVVSAGFILGTASLAQPPLRLHRSQLRQPAGPWPLARARGRWRSGLESPLALSPEGQPPCGQPHYGQSPGPRLGACQRLSVFCQQLPLRSPSTALAMGPLPAGTRHGYWLSSSGVTTPLWPKLATR
jgi:hypothetical protein